MTAVTLSDGSVWDGDVCLTEGGATLGELNKRAHGEADTPSQAAARAWLHAYGIYTSRYTDIGEDHPAMASLPAAFEKFAEKTMTDTPDPTTETPTHPEGEYAIVELMGHTTLVGRIAEVERFGTKMLAMEAIFKGSLLPAIFQGGAAIYRLTPCSAEIAFKRAPTERWHLPASLLNIVPQALLGGPVADAEVVYEGDDDPDNDPDETF